MDLKKFCTSLPIKLGPSLLLSILLDVAKGLHFLHLQKCAHRDLCTGRRAVGTIVIFTENVLVHGDTTAKIADFGISKFLGEHSNTADLGHDFFRAPEMNLCCYSLSVDIWSFGMLMADMLICSRIAMGDHEPPLEDKLPSAEDAE
jgi:serine/threonine protein kinase